MGFSSTVPVPRIDASAARRLVLAALPRRLRICLDSDMRIPAAREALRTEIATLVPEATTLAAIWCTTATAAGADPWCNPDFIVARKALVALLDHHAAATDLPAARALADVVILLTCGGDDLAAAARLALPLWLEAEELDTLALQLSAIAQAQATIGLGRVAGRDQDDRDVHEDAAEAVLVDAWTEALEEVLLSLSATVSSVVAAAGILSRGASCDGLTCTLLARALTLFGGHLTQPVADQAEERERRRRRVAEEALAKAEKREREASRSATVQPRTVPASAETASIPAGHLLVVAAIRETGTDRTRSVARGYEHVIGRALPLAPVPDLWTLRSRLTYEFPYAAGVIDRLLGDLIGCSSATFRPTVIVGPAGAGKSRLLSRLAHHLGIGLWRIDATHDGGAAIGGLDRRWSNTEPAHPVLAIARYSIANPIILLDEIEKAATGTTHGRLWDSLLPMLERETAAVYPDPAFQTTVDISRVSWLATANDTDRLPGPLLDRLRRIEMPAPCVSDLESLLPPVLAEIAASRGLDPAFLPALDGEEIAVIRENWRGGSIRRLIRLVEAVLTVRETLSPKH